MSEQSLLRALPSADRVLRTPRVAALTQSFQRPAVVRLVRRVLDQYRKELAGGRPAPSLDAVVHRVCEEGARWTQGPIGVINATGVVLHTNLGRAPWSADAVRAAVEAAAYADLEYDLGPGERGSRQQHVQRLLTALLDVENAYVAVNSAAALFLALRVVANRKEVILSRGQSVEIGGGFRVPVIMRESGARLIEVGTTNRTRLSDYEEAVTDRTAAILHVHSSNFRVVGFTEEVPLAALAALAHRHGIPLIDDNGSGSLLDTSLFGLGREPMPSDSVEAGTDLITFSGDKLLGGPQAGILVGRADIIQRIARHPIARALRPEKSVLAALAATLLAYLRGDAEQTVPIWKMIALSELDMRVRAERFAERAREQALHVSLEPGESTVGGGSLPGETLPTMLVALPHAVTASALRRGSTPVVARTRGRHVLVDLRTVPPEEDEYLLQLICDAARVDREKKPVLDSGTS